MTVTSSLILRSIIAAAGLSLLVSVGACGKRKPPLPPTPKVVQRAQVTGFQRGDRVILSWKMPETNAPKGDVQHISRVDVYRLAESAGSPLTLSEEEFASRSVVIGSVRIDDADFGRSVSYTDPLRSVGQAARLRYAVRFVNASGQKAAFSNFLVVEPDPKVAAAPVALKAEVTQDAIELRWTASARNADGTSPVNLIGYNIYRSDSKTEPAKLINRQPVKNAEFDDEQFEFEKNYFYFVRAVSAGVGVQPVESGESNIVEVLPKDNFAPAAPTGVTIAASPDTISLFFPPSPESDVVGYNIYRSEDESLPFGEWERLTGEPQENNTYEDKDVAAGKVYFYRITALDRFKNESKPSETVSEKLP